MLSRDLDSVPVMAAVDGYVFPTTLLALNDDGTATLGVGIHLQMVWRLFGAIERDK